jgi:hypothetical protein
MSKHTKCQMRYYFAIACIQLHPVQTCSSALTIRHNRSNLPSAVDAVWPSAGVQVPNFIVMEVLSYLCMQMSSPRGSSGHALPIQSLEGFGYHDVLRCMRIGADLKRELLDTASGVSSQLWLRLELCLTIDVE